MTYFQLVIIASPLVVIIFDEIINENLDQVLVPRVDALNSEENILGVAGDAFEDFLIITKEGIYYRSNVDWIQVTGRLYDFSPHQKSRFVPVKSVIGILGAILAITSIFGIELNSL